MAYKTLFKLNMRYNLQGSTVCLSLKYFENYLLDYTVDELKNYGNKLSVTAAICLRIAIKFNETSQDT